MSGLPTCPTCSRSHSPLAASGQCLTCDVLTFTRQEESNDRPPVRPSDNGATVQHPSSDVDVREVLDATYDFLSRFLVMSDDGLRVLTLWVFHTWSLSAAETTPYISIRSPERESGKTRVIEVVSLITRRSEQVADASISALFRRSRRSARPCCSMRSTGYSAVGTWTRKS